MTAELEPLKILFLSMEYPPETGFGGIGSSVAEMAPALASLGHEVHVLSCVPGQARRDYVDSGVEIHRRDHVPVRGLGTLLRARGTAYRLKTALSCYVESRRLGFKPDVIEAPDWFAEGLVFALLRARPLVGHLHTPLLLVARYQGLDFDWDARLSNLIERTATRRSQIVTSPSHLLVHELRKAGWLGDRPVRIVRQPAALGRWADVPPAEKAAPLVLAVGRLEPRKDPEVVIEAAARLADDVKGLEVVFVGRSNHERDGKPYSDWLEELASRRNAPCRFIEEVPRDELPTWYGRSRLAVVASRFDSFGVAGVEAMAAGRPLVCTSSTGIAELVNGSRAGLVVPPRDPDALAAALRRFLLDPVLASSAGQEARELVVAHCSPERIAREREACYREALAEWKGDRHRNGQRFARRQRAAA